MRDTWGNSSSLVILGGPGAGKSTAGDLVMSARLFPVSARTFGAFGCTVGRGLRPRIEPIWARGHTKRFALTVSGLPARDRLHVREHMIWLNRFVPIPRDSHWKRVVELSLHGLGRKTEQRWFTEWKRRVDLEIDRANGLLFVVAPRGLGRGDAALLESFLSEFPSATSLPSMAWINALDEAPVAEMAKLAAETKRDLSYMLPVREVASIRMRILRRQLIRTGRRPRQLDSQLRKISKVS